MNTRIKITLTTVLIFFMSHIVMGTLIKQEQETATVYAGVIWASSFVLIIVLTLVEIWSKDK